VDLVGEAYDGPVDGLVSMGASCGSPFEAAAGLGADDIPDRLIEATSWSLADSDGAHILADLHTPSGLAEAKIVIGFCRQVVPTTSCWC